MTERTSPLPATTAMLALARLTLKRITRGKLIWISLAIAILPMLFAATLAVGHSSNVLEAAFAMQVFAVAIIPPLFCAPAIAEELEDRTASYLWSRPIPRWVLLAGKLLALAPFAMLCVTASWLLTGFVGLGHAPPGDTIIAVAAGAFGVGVTAAGIASLAPKRGMALAIIYILIIDLPVGQIPASLAWLSVTHAATVLAGFETAPIYKGAIAMSVLCAIWLTVSFGRLSRIEA
jgi:ABC-type transport system involved in multi-copper enzyme maturation permease subunit